MNLKKYFAAVLALFVFIFFYDWLINGVLLKNMYEQTAAIWKKSSQFLAIGFQLVFAAWTALMFALLCREGGTFKGLLFGLLIGGFAGLLTSSWYLWLPIPAELAWSWFSMSVMEGVGAGLILGAIYSR